MVLFALNYTSQLFAQCKIVEKLVFRIIAASSGMLTVMYKLMSLANKRIEPPMDLLISQNTAYTFLPLSNALHIMWYVWRN